MEMVVGSPDNKFLAKASGFSLHAGVACKSDEKKILLAILNIYSWLSALYHAKKLKKVIVTLIENLGFKSELSMTPIRMICNGSPLHKTAYSRSIRQRPHHPSDTKGRCVGELIFLTRGLF